MTGGSSLDPRVDTPRPAATAGLAYFSAVRPIAVAVGVALPPDPELAARFAVTEGIDLAALVADAATLRSVASAAGDCAETAGDVARRMSPVWSGPSADAAHDCVGRHVARAEAGVEHVREVAIAVESAASAISRVLVAKYLAIAAIHTDLVAGRPMVGLTHADVEDNAAVIAADITAKLLLFDRAVGIADSAISEILVVLGAAFEGGPTSSYPEPGGWTAPVRAAARRGVPRSPGASRTDVAMGAAAPMSPRAAPRRRSTGGVGERSRVAAGGAQAESATHTTHGGTVATPRSGAGTSVSMVAAIAEAALTSASAVGMAAAGGLGAALNLAIDAITPSGGGDEVLTGASGSGSSDAPAGPDTVILNLELDHDTDTDTDNDREVDHGAQPPTGRSGDGRADGGDAAPTTRSSPPSVDEAGPAVVSPRSWTVPVAPPEAEPPPEAELSPESAPPPVPAPESDIDPAPTGSGDGERAASPGPEYRTDEPAANTPPQPTASPDPGDDGGLALAGDR